METKTKKVKLYKVKLYTKYMDELIKTKKLFNETIKSYFDYLMEHKEMLKLNNNQCLRELHKIKTYSLPHAFDEAAIIQAMNEARKQLKNPKCSLKKEFNYSPIFYPRKKGTYKLQENVLKLKLFNGVKWSWYPIKLKHWTIAKNMKPATLRVIIEDNHAIADISVYVIFANVTPIEDKIKKDNINVCGFTFTNTNKFVVCTIINNKGKFVKSLYITGANQYLYKAKKILNRIKKHSKEKDLTPNEYRQYFKKLSNMKKYYVESICKQIIDFCKSNNAQIISTLSRNVISQNQNIMYFDNFEGKYSSIDISDEILKCLEYDAYSKDISVEKFNYLNIMNIYKNCNKCMQPLKFEKDKSQVKCASGHTEDYYFNASINIAKACIRKFIK